MAFDKNQIKELLGTGLPTEVVASAIGCDQSYISHLMADEHFSMEVVALRTKALQEHNQRDRKINDIEDQLIDKLHDAVETNAIYKPGDILRSFAVVNNARRRGVPAQQSAHVQNTVVNLILPPVLVRQFLTDSRNEVVEVDGQTLVTMPSSSLLKHLAEHGKDGGKYAKVARYLPSSQIERTPVADETG